METAVWLWCYDKRWAFNLCHASITRIWVLPITFNAFVLVSTVVGLRSGQQDEWGSLSMLVKVKLVLLLLSMIFMVLLIWQADKILNEDFFSHIRKGKDAAPTNSKYLPHFWIRKHVLLSWAGFTTLLLSLGNLIVGLNLFKDYRIDKFQALQFSNIISNVILIDISVGILSMIPFVLNCLAFVFIKVFSAAIATLFPVRWVVLHR
eukprot:TRINITY_DN3758_c0_g1_i4.p1 TRINITY_DN3758_c0_g1~~TRINITY_DN3758_c0_g1_i4.p1  ORF type:complete len:206 (-),score=17.65 TRINITY_DN3758_c0_g1_i4:126-743(-)